MVHPMGEGFGDDAKGDASDQFDRPQVSEAPDESVEIVGSQSSEDLFDARRSSVLSGLSPGRIGGVLLDGAESDLLLGRNVENEILLWLQALDLQFMGGCRTDERLKPLLKLEATSGAAEDQFMTQLVQHFQASEVAVLARCLCLPLVSVRAGKITKQGNMLCPTASRGFLSLTLLASSHMRISFTGDDGCIERLAVISNDQENSPVIIEIISADTSGRSFLLRFSDSRVLFFWCSEKSKTDGMELILKMKDLLENKPSLSLLTGISKTRLDSFAAHLRDYMLASACTSAAAFTLSSGLPMSFSNSHLEPNLASNLGSQSKPSHVRVPEAHVYQTSPSPRSNVFNAGTFTRNDIREKVRTDRDSSINIQPRSAPVSSPDHSVVHNGTGNVESHGLLLPLLSPLSSPIFSLCPTFTIPSKSSSQSSFFSPYYCWCPPCPTPLQYSTTSHLPCTSELLPLPPLSTLLSSTAPPKSSVMPKYPLDMITDLPTRKLPSILPDPLLHLSMPIVASLCPLPSSQQMASFTPFMSDPIVHIPMIDICSSGQGYLVNAGPSMSAAIPPLPITRANHIIPHSESSVEKNARETLRMLMASTPTLNTPKLFNVFPQVLGSMELCGDGVSMSGNASLCEGEVDFESCSQEISSTKLSYSAGDIDVSDVFSDSIEECINCLNKNNSRTSNTESDEM